MDLPLGRKLPLLMSGLILFVLLVASSAAYLEVERSAMSAADNRVSSLAKQLADLVHTSVVARGVMMRRAASDSAVKRLIRLEPGDAYPVARETAALAEPMAALKGLALVTTIPPGTCECHTDFIKLRQILLNLLSNAIKFTNEGTVTLGVRTEGAEMLFTVSDTGIGIAAEHRGRVFEPFYQVEMSKARRVAGTGLGLSVTRHLARLLGGDISLLDEGDLGSTFEVRLPRNLILRNGDTTEHGPGERMVLGRASTNRHGVELPEA